MGDTLIPTLQRPIGLVPEIKYPHEYTTRLGQDIELLHLQLLEKYNYLTYDAQSDYYSVKTLCEFAIDAGLTECDDIYAERPSVVLQSFNAPSLDVFKQYTDAPLVYLGYFDYDLMDQAFVEWVMSNYDGLGLNVAGIPSLRETLIAVDYNSDDYDFPFIAYTLDADVGDYFDIISNATFIDGIFTDEVDTARVIQQTLDYVKANDIRIHDEVEVDDKSGAVLMHISFFVLFFIMLSVIY